MNDKFRLLTIGLACVFGSFPQISAAASPLKNSEFLAWNESTQEFYIQTSILTASVVAAKINPSQSRCIDEWYASDVEAARSFIYRNMRRYLSDHPTGVIVAVLEKQCGAFDS